MEINRQNYEMYLLDYIEGHLPENMVPAMIAFLKNNPDIENEAGALLENVFAPEFVKFDNKNTLKKTLGSDIPGISKFEQLSVACVEKEISKEEQAYLNILIDKDLQKKKEHQLIQKTKILADLSVVFEHKNRLKHSAAVIRLLSNRTYWAVAASIAVLFTLGILLMQNQKTEYGKAISWKQHDFKIHPKLEYQVVYKENSDIRIKLQTVKNVVDSVVPRETIDINAIGNKQIAQIDFTSSNQNPYIKDILELNSRLAYNNDLEFQTLQEYLNAKFKEKVLKQDKNQKVNFISVVNAFGRFTKKVFNKKIEIEKTNSEDGSSLYALKTDSYDFYTIRSNRKKSNQKEQPKGN